MYPRDSKPCSSIPNVENAAIENASRPLSGQKTLLPEFCGAFVTRGEVLRQSADDISGIWKGYFDSELTTLNIADVIRHKCEYYWVE